MKFIFYALRKTFIDSYFWEWIAKSGAGTILQRKTSWSNDNMGKTIVKTYKGEIGTPYFPNLVELNKFIFYALRKIFITAIFGNRSQKVGLSFGSRAKPA
jgi:hypothetical protein